MLCVLLRDHRHKTPRDSHEGFSFLIRSNIGKRRCTSSHSAGIQKRSANQRLTLLIVFGRWGLCGWRTEILSS